MISPDYVAPPHVIYTAGAMSFLFMWAWLKYEYVKDRTRQYFKPLKSKWTWIIVIPLSIAFVLLEGS